MDKYTKQEEIAVFLDRRLHAVKLATSLLLKELSDSSRDSVILTRRAAMSIFMTIDTFIEDAEKLLEDTGSGKAGAYREAPIREKTSSGYGKPVTPLREVKQLK